MEDNKITFIKPSEFPSTGWLKIDTNQYECAKINLNGITFSLLGRKSDGIGVDRFKKALQVSWPKWQSLFPIKTPEITIAEGDISLGGGALEDFTVGIFLATNDLNQAAQDNLRSVLGWDSQPNAISYIKKYYSEFDDPLQAYVNNQMIHELGHIYFLNGVTKLDNSTDSAPQDTWFALGLGIVYDKFIWSEIYNTPSPKLEAFVKNYEERYSGRTDIDQRLINPDISSDEAAGVTPMLRLQIYDHIKAFIYLNQLRINIGLETFDHYVVKYLSRPIGSKASYDIFLELLTKTDLQIVKETEFKYCIR